MKKHLATFFALTLLATGAFAQQASISITPPTITDWSYNGFSPSSGEITTMNNDIKSAFSAMESTLNTNYFNNMKGFPKLNRGFANANTAAFDNASLLGYQNYDLFAVSVGGNLGLAVPSTNPAGAASALNDVVNDGDIYVGLATGGFAAQAGLNLGFLIPNLYGTVKMGFIPTIPSGDVSYQQGMFGLGANYTLVKGFDLLFGLVKWRGLNVGSGLVFNGNKVTASIPVPSPTPQTFTEAVNGQTVHMTVAADSVKANLTIDTSSVVVPIDLMTSIQALWFLNVGLGVGADLALSSGSVKVGGSSALNLTADAGTLSTTPGSVAVTSPGAKNGGDFFMPRLAASLGLNVAIFKLDVPVSYYPLSQAFAVGVTGAVVW